MTFNVKVKIYHILIIQFKPTKLQLQSSLNGIETVSQLTETVKVLLRIDQYDLVESIKNTNNDACRGDS